jgi:hypothetical protein
MHTLHSYPLVFNVAHAVHVGAPNAVIDVPAQASRDTSTQAPARLTHVALRASLVASWSRHCSFACQDPITNPLLHRLVRVDAILPGAGFPK